MRKTKVSQLRMAKVENKLFACRLDQLVEKASELNELFAAGWLTEETQVIGDTYLALLKKEGEGRKVFYVDVGNMQPSDVQEYMERVKELMSNPSGVGDFFIPCR